MYCSTESIGGKACLLYYYLTIAKHRIGMCGLLGAGTLFCMVRENINCQDVCQRVICIERLLEMQRCVYSKSLRKVGQGGLHFGIFLINFFIRDFLSSSVFPFPSPFFPSQLPFSLSLKRCFKVQTPLYHMSPHLSSVSSPGNSSMHPLEQCLLSVCIFSRPLA